jgi:hypothetical protein
MQTLAQKKTMCKPKLNITHNLLSHEGFGQGRVSFNVGHSNPSNLGAGFVHLLFRYWTPELPHDLEQYPHDSHSVCQPSAVEKVK